MLVDQYLFMPLVLTLAYLLLESYIKLLKPQATKKNQTTSPIYSQ